jgi:hypothetical protein
MTFLFLFGLEKRKRWKKKTRESPSEAVGASAGGCLEKNFSGIYAALAHATAHTHHATTHDRSDRIVMTIVVVHWVTFGSMQM